MLRWIYIIIAFSILATLGFKDYLITDNIFINFSSASLFFLEYFKIPLGLNTIISAYILRFLIRRLHLIS